MPVTPRADFSKNIPAPTPYWLERLGIFSFKGVIWLFIGAVIGSFFAQIQGFMPAWFFLIHLFGSIGLGALFVVIFLVYSDRRLARTAAQSNGCGNKGTAPARIDDIQSGHIRMLESRTLMIIQVTVFSKTGEPYETTVRQFMTAEEIDQLREGGVITFYEDMRDHGYGRVSSDLPAGEIPGDVNTFVASKLYPDRRNAGLWLLVGRHPTMFTRSVSYLLIFILFSVGFLSPYQATGNMDWLRMSITYFPQRLIFQDKGNFNPEAFKKAYDKAIAYIGDRPIESLLFYKSLTSVRAEHPRKPGIFRSVTIRGNSVGMHFMSSPAVDPERLFTADSISYDLFKKALDDAAKDHDIDDIMYIGVRKGIRWGTRDGRIPPDYTQDRIDIHIVFEGGKKSLSYHGETGDRLPE